LGRLQRFPQLEERLALVCTLSPLSESETAGYIAHRLEVAGSRATMFHDAAIRRIWESSAGIPRRIDRLCDFSLLVGFAEGLSVITAEHIDGVSQELCGRKAA
jgi:general secretion pathway protein A